MKASTPIVPSLGLNAVRLSLLSGAVTAALGAPAMAQESMEIELDPFEHTVFVPGEDTRDVLVTGVKTATITAGFNNVLPLVSTRKRPSGFSASASRTPSRASRWSFPPARVPGFGRHNDHRDGHVEPA